MSMTSNRFVKGCAKLVRDRLLAMAEAIDRINASGKTRAASGTGPFDHLPPNAMDEIYSSLRSNPFPLLQIRQVRAKLSHDRIKVLMQARKMDRADGSNVAHNTVDYNIEGAISAPGMDRPSIMVNVVTSIEKVRTKVTDLSVLSIGPRSESEIFGILAAGFQASHLSALDLFSYSPYVQAGDMHAMPYPDSSFDVVFVGWVLSYSKDQAAAAREILRVCRNGAVVAVAGDYSDNKRDNPVFNNENSHMQSCEQILSLFEGHVGNVYFRHEPRLPDVHMVMAVFEARK